MHVYTYAHLPLVLSVLLFAFAMRAMFHHVTSKLTALPALALCCGSALYLLAFVVLRWRISRNVGRGRPIAAATFATLTPIPVLCSALLGLVAVVGVWFGLHAYELIWWRDERARRRSSDE